MSEVDTDFINACQGLYEKHKSVFDTIYENLELGGTSNEAIKSFLAKEVEIKLNFSNNRWLSFIPKCIDEKMPNGTFKKAWQKQYKPVVFFFELKKDRVSLVVEVGPIEDLDLRNRLVTLLNRSVNKTDKGANSNTYTRIWTKSEKFSSNVELEEVSTEDILNIMNNLYTHLKNVGVIENTISVLSEVFVN